MGYLKLVNEKQAAKLFSTNSTHIVAQLCTLMLATEEQVRLKMVDSVKNSREIKHC